MKDLKHYFTDSVKTCEAPNDDKEVTIVNPGIPTSSEASSTSPTAMTNTSKKRERVKIRISRKNSTKVKVCNIIDSNDDLVDKTPSPFATSARGCKIDVRDDNDTPKRSSSGRRNSEKIHSTEIVESEDPDENDDESSADAAERCEMNDSAIFEARPRIGAECDDGGREESNAFRVLMTRKKSARYKEAAATATSAAEEEAAAEERRAKQKANREKLVAMADKKGYSKRKVEELEEAEKIERRLEKRAKVFKQMGKREGEKNPERRVLPGSLHDYFSKPNPEQKQEELMAVCNLAAQAEAVSDVEILQDVQETRGAEMAAEKGNRKTPEKNSENERVSGNPNSLDKVLSEQFGSNQQRSRKPKWSLRINLAFNGNDVATDDSNLHDDKSLPNARRESRHRKSKSKSTNYEENDNSDGDLANPKMAKKKKSAPQSQKNKISTKTEQTDERNEVSTIEKNSVSTSPELEIIEIKVNKRSTTEKLAPLFVKRQKPDPAILEARRLFLHSIPTKMENSKTERRLPIVGTPLLPFPAISHVTQLDVPSKVDDNVEKIKFPIRENRPFAPSFDPDDLKSITSAKIDNFSPKNFDDSTDNEITTENLEQSLSNIETRCSDAREIWKRVSIAANFDENSRVSPKKKMKKRKSNETKKDVPKENVGQGRAWTQKYRPLSAREVVGNEEAAEKLRKWLEVWKATVRKPDDDGSSSGDEFYSSDCDYSSNFDNNRVAVLLGPHGSGKTASVYAVAEELGYSVLEINASSRRAGKKILKELEEATKSHRIKKPGATSVVPSLIEKKIASKNSLILVEDVDLIFEEDEGFISATCQLASNTKRPMVMTVRDTCSHLNRMAPQQHRIYYQATVGPRTSALLELITLAECGYRLPGPCLDRLLLGGDLRKALLQLQYLLLSGKPKASEVPTNFHRSLWRDMRNRVYKPAMKATKKSSKKSKNSVDEKNVASSKDLTVVVELARNLDRLSFVSTLVEIDDPAIENSTLKIEPGLSLHENDRSYSSAISTGEEIAKWLRDRTMIGNDISDNASQTLQRLSVKKEFNSGINFALSQISPMIVDRRTLAVDYLPCVREICRSENVRITTNNKRGNRFFHYLQSLKLPTTSTRPNILSAACKIMQEKSYSES